jgi:hypothetical protein
VKQPNDDAAWFAENPDARMRTRLPFAGEFHAQELAARPDREPMVIVTRRRGRYPKMLAWRLSSQALLEVST